MVLILANQLASKSMIPKFQYKQNIGWIWNTVKIDPKWQEILKVYLVNWGNKTPNLLVSVSFF
jgi:hypothetical protein